MTNPSSSETTIYHNTLQQSNPAEQEEFIPDNQD